MNVFDVTGIVFIVIGLLCILATAYLSPIFLIVSGGFLSAGIVLVLTAGNMCRAKEDLSSEKGQLHATLKLDDGPDQISATLTPALILLPG